MAEAAQSYLPVGSGLGSFDPVYRSVEPLERLDATFFNQAHNDYLEIWLETGWIGAGLTVFGILFESLGDWQMVRFKKTPGTAGTVMDKGLWRYTQHPNYFGDLCVWFGLWLIAAETGLLGAVSIVGPLLLVVMFLKYSGGVSYEKRLKHTRPGYEGYMARTSLMIPWPPRKVAVDTKSPA